VTCLHVNCAVARGRTANSPAVYVTDLERSRAKSSFAIHQGFVRTAVIEGCQISRPHGSHGVWD
jgi:hypothetical protein